MSNKIQKNTFVVMSYILITTIFIFMFIKSKHYLLMADSSFQLSRANEIYQNLKQGGFFTFIASHCFSQSGVGKKIVSPNEGFQFPYSFNDLLTSSFTNIADFHGRTSIGIFLILTMLIGWTLPQLQHNKHELMIYLLGFFIILCSTTYLAWQILGSNKFILHTIGRLQMMFRLLPYGSLLLSVTFSFIIDNCFDSILSNKEIYLLLGIFTLVIIGGYYGSVQGEVQMLDHPSSQQTLIKVNSEEKPVISINKIVSAKTYNHIFDYQIIYGETDYYNERALIHNKSIINNWTYINGKKCFIRKKSGVNKITMEIKTNKASQVDLPIIDYHNTYVMNNGKKITHQMSNRGTVECHLKKGFNLVKVGYKPSPIYYGLLIISLITWIMLLLRLYLKNTL